MELTFLAAYLGGMLALLSPCGALLLPAFFASTARSGARLLAHGAVFFLGLALTLVPLGLGASLAGSLLTAHRDLIIAGAGWLIIAFGLMQVLGAGFDLSRLLPGVRTAQATAQQRGGFSRSFLLGLVSGVAGFCSGPILGAVLTMAATEDSPIVAGSMLAVYTAGMVVPLLGIAAWWNRLGTRGRARLRGREIRIGRLRFHTTSLVTGVLLVIVGIVFLLTHGMASLPALLPTTVLGRVQTFVLSITALAPEPLLIAPTAIVVIALWAARRRRQARRGESDATITDATPASNTNQEVPGE
ncbi:cytochrome c biogenesis CcdA family protein [Isoptericola sp. NPDC019693]|uniref:cytochrome c biogenesis CcdA family protein n=1 Tax=Isoptericola sp. NPDC019693 TaxID=3364009 RepID=UPI0037B013B8